MVIKLGMTSLYLFINYFNEFNTILKILFYILWGVYILKPKILIVEDEQIEAMDYKQYLNSCGTHVVGIASTGEDAVKNVAELKPDLVLMDIVLKGDMDGIEVATKIQDEFDIPVVYITAHPEDNTFNRAKLTSPYGYLLKPVSQTVLRNIIKLALHKHQLKSKLRESEKKYRMIFENTGTITVILDKDMTISDVNSRIEKLSGFRKEEIISKKWTDFIIPREQERIKNYSNLRKIDPATPKQYETKVIDANNNIKDVLINVTSIPDYEQRLVTILDITENKNAKRSLEESKRLLSDIINFLLDATFVIDIKGKVIAWNHAMEEMTHVKREDILGKKDYEYALPFYGERRPVLIDLVLNPNKKIESNYDNINRKGDTVTVTVPIHFNGKKHILWGKAVRLYDSKGNITGTIESIRDITKHKQNEDNLKKSLEEKDLLLKEIHHRVKNNLQIIHSLHNLQEDYVKGNPTAINILHESQNRVISMAMIHEMLYQSNDLNNINFNSYVRNLVTAILNSYGATHNITPIFDIKDFNPNIETAIPLGLIICELVSNSLKYAFPNKTTGEVTLSLKPYEKQYQLIISDNVIGLPENLDFQNTEIGLGLRLVNSLVQQLDGNITLDRSQGTKYTINFKELKYKKRINNSN